MPAADRRTVGELLTDSDALARETLLDLSPDHAPAMLRSWGELVGSAADSAGPRRSARPLSTPRAAASSGLPKGHPRKAPPKLVESSTVQHWHPALGALSIAVGSTRLDIFGSK